MEFYPELMRFENGERVVTAADMDRRRKELIEILCREAYGDPIPPVPVTGRTVDTDTHCAGMRAVIEDIRVSCRMGDAVTFTFPLRFYRPANGERRPVILALNFRRRPYDEYLQPEAALDAGFSLAVVCYKDLSSDDGDFTDKLAAFFPRRGEGRDAGKITVWAWGASRALDYLISRPDVDAASVGVIGHSRLGKTALWAAALDERFAFCGSSGSGSMGAMYARTRHEGGESVDDICRQFPYWFCGNLHRYRADPAAMPFDQHFLIAAVAPRGVSVQSAAVDYWADPPSEQLCCLAASPAWGAYGKRGFVGDEAPCETGSGFREGEVVYHKRDGRHFLACSDWMRFLDFAKRFASQIRD